MNSEEIEMELWQLYRTGDEDKIERLFRALGKEGENADIEGALAYAWGDVDEI